MVFVNILCFLSFSGKNDAESFRNFIKIPFGDPKRALIGADKMFWVFWGAGPLFYVRMIDFDGVNLFSFGASTQNHAESYRNYLKKLFWDPKCVKLDQKSDFGHVRTYC